MNLYYMYIYYNIIAIIYVYMLLWSVVAQWLGSAPSFHPEEKEKDYKEKKKKEMEDIIN